MDRISRHPELEPRVFVSPRFLNETINTMVEFLCFEQPGEWIVGGRSGPSWVMLESSLRTLCDLRWFKDDQSGPPSASVELAYPRA